MGAPQTRGFTEHEHIRQFNIINMNARLYDPKIGKFFSPDNFITESENPQSYNRYSYALNNPLKYTDPTGNVQWAQYYTGEQIDLPTNMSGHHIGFGLNLTLLNDLFILTFNMGTKYSIDYCLLEFHMGTGAFGTFSKYLLDPKGGWADKVVKKSIRAGVGTVPDITSGPSIPLSGEAKKKVDQLNAFLFVIRVLPILPTPYISQEDKWGCVLAAFATTINLLDPFAGRVLPYSEIAEIWDGLNPGEDWRSNGINFGDEDFPELLNYVFALTGVSGQEITSINDVTTALSENNIVIAAINNDKGFHAITLLENSKNAEGLGVYIVWDSGLKAFNAVFTFQLTTLQTTYYGKKETGIVESTVEKYGIGFKRK